MWSCQVFQPPTTSLHSYLQHAAKVGCCTPHPTPTPSSSSKHLLQGGLPCGVVTNWATDVGPREAVTFRSRHIRRVGWGGGGGTTHRPRPHSSLLSVCRASAVTPLLHMYYPVLVTGRLSATRQQTQARIHRTHTVTVHWHWAIAAMLCDTQTASAYWNFCRSSPTPCTHHTN